MAQWLRFDSYGGESEIGAAVDDLPQAPDRSTIARVGAWLVGELVSVE